MSSLSSPTISYSLKGSKIQHTIAKDTTISGYGLFTGRKVQIVIKPAGRNSGVVFRRIDLPSMPSIHACLENVVKTPRCTVIGEASAEIYMVEHLLSAIYGLGIDNVIIDISGPEIPMLDGSSERFVHELAPHIVSQNDTRPIFSLENSVYLDDGDVQIIALPSSEFRISYTLSYPNDPFLKSMFYTTVVSPKTYRIDLAPARTFALYQEVMELEKKGVIRGGGLENGVVVKEGIVLNPEGLRFDNEMVRHKIVDLIGDLSLMQCVFNAHIIAIRSGHQSNIAFGKKLLTCFKKE